MVTGALEVVNPDGTYVYKGNFTTNSLGVATVPTTLQQAGLVEISATLASDDNYGEASGNLNIAVQMPKAIGIVVAGGGTGDVSFSQMSAAADYAYDTLLARGVPAERIAYLHPEYGDVDNGRLTHDASTSSLNTVFGTWAPSLVGVTSDSSAEQTPLFVFMVGVSDTTNTDEFVLNTGTNITPASLEAYFDSFRTSVGTEFTSAGFTAPSELPLFLVMDSDNSALFASTISTTDGAYTFFSASNVSSYGNANFGATGVYSYMYQFMSEVRDNEPFGTAHSTARSSMLYLYGDQEPKLSVDGDSSLEETDDYWDASNLYLEHSVAANNEPILSSSKGNDAYNTSSGNIELWASASDLTATRLTSCTGYPSIVESAQSDDHRIDTYDAV